MALVFPVVIKITSDATQVKKTSEILTEQGRIEKDNALIFEAAAKKRQFLIDANIKRLKKLKQQRKEAFSPQEIRVFDDLIKRTGKDIEVLGGKVKKLDKQSGFLNTTLGKLGAVVVGAFAVRGIINFGEHLLELAVESEVFERRAATVFGNSLEVVKRFAEESANSLGLTEVAFLGAAAAVGDILVPLGLSRKRAAEMSVEAVKLGGALKQFTGDSRSAAEISNIVARALTGEVEGLKTLGVVVDQTSIQFKDLVKSKQLDLGLTKQQAKAETIFQIAVESSSDALESFENNTDSLVRQQAELDAQSAELADTLAHLLAPSFLAVTTEANRAVGSLNAIITAEGSVFEKLFALVDITGVARLRLLSMSLAQKAVRESAEQEAEAEEEVVEIREDHILTIGQLKRELAELRKAQDALIPGSKELALNQARVREIQKILKEEIIKTLTPIEALRKRIASLKKELESQALAGDISTDSIKEYKSAVREAEEAIIDLDKALEDTLKTLPLMNTELSKLFIFEPNFIENTTALEDFFERNGELIDTAIEAEQTLFRIVSQLNTNRLIEIDNRERKELKALETRGLNEEELAEKTIEIQERIAEERAVILRKQAIADKVAAIFDATINGAIAVTKALITSPAFAIAIGVLAAAEIAVIAAQPIPEFHEGKKPELKEGEMYAKILKTESVIPPEQSRKYKGIIDSVIDNKLEKYVFDEYMLPMIANMGGEKSSVPYNDVHIWNMQKKQLKTMQRGNALIEKLAKSMDNSSHRRTWRN